VLLVEVNEFKRLGNLNVNERNTSNGLNKKMCAYSRYRRKPTNDKVT
jgi:hypothetical protein